MNFFRLLLLFLITSIPAMAESARISKITDLRTIDPQVRDNQKYFRMNIKIPGSGKFNLSLRKHALKSVSPHLTLADGKIVKDRAAIKLFRGTTKQEQRVLKVAAASYKIKGHDYLQISFLSYQGISNKMQFNHLSIPLKLNQQQAKLTSIRRFMFSDLPVAPAISDADKNQEVFQLSSSTKSSRSLQNMLEMELSVDADSHWHSIFGSSSSTALLDYINTTETVYQSELGITFNVVRLNVFTSLSFGNSNPYSKLCNYQYYTSGVNSLSTNSNCLSLTNSVGPQSYFGTADAYYLFTGQDLEGSTIGIAFYSSICRAPQQAIGLVQYFSGYPALLPMTFAHELGHNLSAIHDGTSNDNGLADINCTSAPANKIMASSLSSLPNGFSNCSIDTINDFLGSYNTCLPLVQVDIPDPSPTPSPSSSPNPVPVTISLSAKLNKTGQFVSKLDLSANSGVCSSKLYVSPNKSNFDDANAINFNQNEDLEFSSVLKATILANAKGKYPPIFLKAKSTCSGHTSESSVVKINPHKIISIKTLRHSIWAKRLLKKLKNKYGL